MESFDNKLEKPVPLISIGRIKLTISGRC